ncbi:MAG: FHA domain-containing protein, partial [Myxococcales bacterium]|nr:FHA domain-containing protein [Myxococcales bacterium]
MTFQLPPQPTAETQQRPREGATPGGRYLAVFEPGSSRVVPLPEGGELVIGRSTDVSLRLADPTVSRRHAKLVVAADAVLVFDLESQNGTFVDGELVVGSRALASGEVIEISESAIVFHDQATRTAQPRGVPMGAFRDRVRDELTRAEATGRPVTVLLLQLEPDAPMEPLLAAVSAALFPLELAAGDGPHRIAVLLPELAHDEALARAHALGALVTAAGARCKVGFACGPADGCDADTLVGSARAAATIASVGTVLLARETMRVVPLGDASAIVADAAMLRVYALAERLAQS